MATTIGIVGKSGSGKSTSGKALNPEETYWINCDKKSLPFKGWKSAYNAEKKNYYKGSDLAMISKILAGISDKRPEIKVIIIDTVNAIMLDDEMSKIKQKGYDKWTDLVAGIYELIQLSNSLRDDLMIIMMFHQDEYRDDITGQVERRILTNGRKLEKIQLETKLPIVLYSVVEGTGGNNQYYFETQANNSTGKSPAGMFETFKIDNNLRAVIEAVKNYE